MQGRRSTKEVKPKEVLSSAEKGVVKRFPEEKVFEVGIYRYIYHWLVDRLEFVRGARRSTQDSVLKHKDMK